MPHWEHFHLLRGYSTRAMLRPLNQPLLKPAPEKSENKKFRCTDMKRQWRSLCYKAAVSFSDGANHEKQHLSLLPSGRGTKVSPGANMDCLKVSFKRQRGRKKKKRKDSEAQQWFCRQKEEISTTVYEQGVGCIENQVNGHAQRVVVTGMSPAEGQQLAVYPRGQYWPNNVQDLYKLCGWCTLGKFADAVELEGVADTPAGHAAIQGDQDKLEKCAARNLTKFIKEKEKVLHLGRNRTAGHTRGHPAGKQPGRKISVSPGGHPVEHVHENHTRSIAAGSISSCHWTRSGSCVWWLTVCC